jgi:hypothetical protein
MALLKAICTHLISLSTPFVQLSHLPYNGFKKLNNDQLEFLHTYGISHKILYFG